MKNVTISLEEELARWARVKAARENTSVSRLLSEVLREEMARDLGYEMAMKQYLSRKPKRLRKSGKLPRREELHDRRGLR